MCLSTGSGVAGGDLADPPSFPRAKPTPPSPKNQNNCPLGENENANMRGPGSTSSPAAVPVPALGLWPAVHRDLCCLPDTARLLPPPRRQECCTATKGPGWVTWHPESSAASVSHP